MRAPKKTKTLAAWLEFDNSQECIAKKRQWRRHAANCIPPAEVALNLAFGDFEKNGDIYGRGGRGRVSSEENESE